MDGEECSSNENDDALRKLKEKPLEKIVKFYQRKNKRRKTTIISSNAKEDTSLKYQ